MGSVAVAVADQRRHGRRLAVALIVACLAVARSPSSAIALVSELDAAVTLTMSCAPAGLGLSLA